MMHQQGPRNSDEHVDVQDLLRSLPRVTAPDNFEQKLAEKIEAENLGVAYQLTNLPKVPSISDFNDRLQWSIAVHNQISGGAVAQAVEESVVVAESAGGRLWLRTGLLLLALAIGVGSWAVMGEGTVPASSPAQAKASSASAPTPASTVVRAAQSVTAPAAPPVVSSTGTASSAPVASSEIAAPFHSATVSSPSVNGAIGEHLLECAPASPAAVRQELNRIKTSVSSAERSATTEYRSASAGGQRVSAGADTTIVQAGETVTQGGAPQVGQIETGPDGGNDAKAPTDSIHTGEHRADGDASRP
jgi:hypothetical protein